jgi:uncharacterized protein (TIGR03067 family)
MKPTLALIAVSLSLGLAQGGELASRTADLSRLQGRWSAKAGVRRELQVELEVIGQDVKVAITTPQGLNIKVRGGLRLNESTSPRSLDWVRLYGPDEQPLPEIAAIYKVDGETFTVCNGGFLGARPREFKAGDGALADVVVFKRLNSTGNKTATRDRPDRLPR